MRLVLSGCAVIGLLIAAPLTGATSDRSSPRREEPTSGSHLYRTYCAQCHGEDGRGGGVVARLLKIQAPSLRAIAQRRGGVFPSEEVARIIDGRGRSSIHRRDEMPPWGVVFANMDFSDERAIAQRIGALVTYLESIQTERGRLAR